MGAEGWRVKFVVGVGDDHLYQKYNIMRLNTLKPAPIYNILMSI